jgi:hypothetical protein
MSSRERNQRVIAAARSEPGGRAQRGGGRVKGLELDRWEVAERLV